MMSSVIPEHVKKKFFNLIDMQAAEMSAPWGKKKTSGIYNYYSVYVTLLMIKQ